MAPNRGVSRKTTSTSTTKANDDQVLLENLFAGARGPEGGRVAKDKLATSASPGIYHSDDPAPRAVLTGPLSRSKILTKVPSTMAKAFANARPMADKPELLKCTHCKRTVSEHEMPRHIETCLNKKQEKQRKKKEAKEARDAAARRDKAGESEEEDDDGTASKNGGGLTASKKRKAADEGEDTAPSKKKKKKDDSRAKLPRPKAPVDVEKQCGVLLDNGGQCARSLTCKSHSMGAKRAVPGRSARYDKLLLDYQRKNQAKMQKAAFDANLPNPDDESLEQGPVDEDEETEEVLTTIVRNWGGRPIWAETHVPLRRKYEEQRREISGMMKSAFALRGTKDADTDIRGIGEAPVWVGA